MFLTSVTFERLYHPNQASSLFQMPCHRFSNACVMYVVLANLPSPRESSPEGPVSLFSCEETKALAGGMSCPRSRMGTCSAESHIRDLRCSTSPPTTATAVPTKESVSHQAEAVPGERGSPSQSTGREGSPRLSPFPPSLLQRA